MATLADLAAAILERNARAVRKAEGRFKVATTSPFEVYLDGSSIAVPARKVTGLSYSVGTTGDYSLRQGGTPLCRPTP